MGTRIIDSPRGRLVTILLTPLVPCSARLAVIALVAGAFFGATAPLAALGVVLLNVVVLLGMSLLASRVLVTQRAQPFIIELPHYHPPNWRGIALSAWHRTRAFLETAGTAIVTVSVIVWVWRPGLPGRLDDLTPGSASSSSPRRALGLDWRMLAALWPLRAKENSIATGVLFASQATSTERRDTGRRHPAAGWRSWWCSRSSCLDRHARRHPAGDGSYGWTGCRSAISCPLWAVGDASTTC